MRVLIAYASKYGATEGIADRIGQTFRDRGFQVEVRRCADMDIVSGFDAYVVGSAAYEFRWLKDARRFVRRNVEELSRHPLWLFSSGPLGMEKTDKNGQDVLAGAEPKQFERYRELLHPRGTRVFRGAYDQDVIRGADRVVAWIPAMRDIMPRGDFREWDQIDAWAGSIAQELQPVRREAHRSSRG